MEGTGRPTLMEENTLFEKGYRRIAGIDEAGRGPLAGPVVAAAVILPNDFEADWKSLVNDSKQLAAQVREELFKSISDIALSVGVGVVDSQTIDTRGIVKATRIAMKQAVEQLTPPPDYLLIDYLKLPAVKVPQKGITYGDCLCYSIACASIIAKVTRDKLMVEFDKTYPGYGFADHKGYGTAEHRACLKKLGPSPIHRCSFEPVRETMMML